MSKLVVLAEIEVDVLEFADLENWLVGVRAERLPGLEAITLWRSLADPKRHLLLSLYASAEESQIALERLAENPLIDQLRSQASVPDVAAATVICGTGRGVEAAGLSLVNVWAAPGYEVDTEQELMDVQGNLTYCAGFKGSILGRNVATPQNVLSLAFWESEDSCRKSLPEQPTHDARLYVQVAPRSA